MTRFAVELLPEAEAEIGDAFEVLHDFPFLTAEDIQACLAYAADRERMQFTASA